MSQEQHTWNGCTGSMDIVSVCAETGPVCTGSGESYSHPSGRYFVTWQRDREKNNMIYTISAQLSDKEKQWLALGFNSENRMPGADAMIAWMENGKPVVSDRHITAYSQPIVDASQDVKVIAGNVANGRTSVTFSRPLVTGDADDFSLNGTSCPYVLVSWGGSVTGSGPSADLGKHTHTQSTGLRRCFTGPPVIVPAPLPGGIPEPASASPLSDVGKIITAAAVLALLFLALLALAMCCRRCLAARHLRRQSQGSYGDKNGSTIGLTSPYTALSNGTSELGIDNPSYNMAQRASLTQGMYITLPDDAEAVSESYGYNQSRMSSGQALGNSQATMTSGDMAHRASVTQGMLIELPDNDEASAAMAHRASVTQGIYMVLPDDVEAAGESYSFNLSRMSSGEALGTNQSRMSSGDVLSSSQARMSSGEALGYNQTTMTSGDVIDSSQSGMLSAGNAQGYNQARKASTVMFSSTEHRHSSASFLLGNGLAMASPGEAFANGSNEHMSSAVTEQGQAGNTSALVLGTNEQRLSSGDILGANAVNSSAVYNRRQSSVVTLQTREYYRSTELPTSSDVNYLRSGLSAADKGAQYFIDEGDTVSGDDQGLIINEEPTVNRHSRFFESTEMVSGDGEGHGGHAFGSGESSQTGAFAYVDGGETGESSTDVNFVLMGLPATSEDAREFNNDMDGEPTVVTGIKSKKNSKLSVSSVTGAESGSMDTTSGEQRTSSSVMETKRVFTEEHSSGGGESKYLESNGGDISSGRKFDNGMEGEPIIVTGFKSKKKDKVSTSGTKSSASGFTGSAFGSSDTTSGEKRTSSSVDKPIALDNSESMQNEANSHDSSYVRSYRSESRQY